jgi:ATP-binding protein involved in chromosome partitioning
MVLKQSYLVHLLNLMGNKASKHAAAAAAISSGAEKLPGIRHVIAVASGKGGVGKSTVSVNLALALRMRGARVGLVDADILGPSIPGMLGIPTGQQPAMTAEGQAIPIERHGVGTMSMGMLTDDDSPAVLRGPMVSKYLKMFIGATQWGPLDYLLLDLPPGTGDIQLTLAQSVPLSGAIIVTTPQDVSLKIARRGLRMFERVHVPILGIIENMSGFTCAHCGATTDVFRRGGGERLSQQLEVPFLGAIPLDADIVAGGDEGRPIVIARPESVAARAYAALAVLLAEQLDNAQAGVLKPFAWKWATNEGAPDWVESASRPTGSRVRPIGLRRQDLRTLAVLWEDGHRHHVDVRDLRLACRCALCIEEMSGRRLLDPKTVRADVTPRVISSVGNYAIGIDWSDDHNSGLYSFDHLRALGERSATLVAEDV